MSRMSQDVRDRKTQAAEPNPDADDVILTAEVVTGPLPNPAGIHYTDWQLRSYAHRYSRLKPIEPGDLCCHCGLDCDGAGFAPAAIGCAVRVNGHPLCGRGSCYWSHLDEFSGKRTDCRCGRRKK